MNKDNHESKLTAQAVAQALGEGFWLGQEQIFCYDQVVSTNITAHELAKSGAGHGTLVLAEQQSGGRGRLGRSWASAAGAGLWFSLVLRPQWPLAEVSRLSFLMAAAVAEGIKAATGLAAQIKWPNDILLNGRKVCGILLEMNAASGAVDYVVAGIGVNVNQRLADFAPELQAKASSLALAKGDTVDRLAVLRAILCKIEVFLQRYQQEGFAPIKAIWLADCAIIGREVCVLHKNTVLQSGRVLGIDDDGALLLKSADGVLERVLSGDVSLRGAFGEYI